MKKLLLVVILAITFQSNMNAQFGISYWYDSGGWNFINPAANNFSGNLYRQGSIAFASPNPWNNQGSDVQNQGIKFYPDYANIHNVWQTANYGLTIANFNSTNISQSEVFSYSNAATMLSGFGGVAITTMNGAMFMHQNGIVSMGLNTNWQYAAKRRELSLKTADFVNNSITGYTLYVKGGMVAEKIKVALIDNWPDYVFKKDYALTPLSMVEAHIMEKGYLHKSKSAEQIEKDGIDVAETAKAQQEKIEELFLHLIDMDKRLKAVEAENAQLKADLNNNKK
jgi:hypothetical protein